MHRRVCVYRACVYTILCMLCGALRAMLLNANNANLYDQYTYVYNHTIVPACAHMHSHYVRLYAYAIRLYAYAIRLCIAYNTILLYAHNILMYAHTILLYTHTTVLVCTTQTHSEHDASNVCGAAAVCRAP